MGLNQIYKLLLSKRNHKQNEKTTYRLQQTHEKMLNITNLQRNANQNQNEVSPHTGQSGHHQKN